MIELFASVCYCVVGSNTGSPNKESLHVLECGSDTGAARLVQSVTEIEGTTYFQISPQLSYASYLSGVYGIVGGSGISQERL
ncbi:MAG: hypothetical protein J6S30_01945 [Kiritimatiellae bacterium]|nr:hypothetical protein [Kiritimatiellia bacterium]